MKLFVCFFKTALKDKAEFNLDLLFELLNYIVYLAVTAFMWTGITSSFGNIGGWSAFSFVMLTCFASLYRSFNDFFAGTWQMQSFILNGNLDKYLCRPVNVFGAIIGEYLNPLSFMEGIITVALTLLISCIIQKPQGIGLFSNIIPSLIVFASGSVAILCIKSIVSLMTVWLGDLSVFQNILFFEDMQLDRYPTKFLPQGFSILLNWIIPLGLIATFPSYVLCLALELKELVFIVLGSMAVALFWITVLCLVYKKAIRHYESFGV